MVNLRWTKRKYPVGFVKSPGEASWEGEVEEIAVQENPNPAAIEVLSGDEEIEGK